MRTRAALTATLLLFPVFASAAAFGFPRQPLWVSATSGIEGETITMYAAVYNASETELKGTVSFVADGAVFDTKSVSLSPGGSSLVTDGWKAEKGTHALSAQFDSGAEKDTTQKISVTITAAPPVAPTPPTVIDKTVSTASDLFQSVAAPSSPVSKVANTIVNTTENLRKAGGDLVRPYATDEPAAKKGSANALSAPSKDPSLVHSITQTAAAAALYAFDIKWLFYALLVLSLYFILRTAKRWVNRPRF